MKKRMGIMVVIMFFLLVFTTACSKKTTAEEASATEPTGTEVSVTEAPATEAPAAEQEEYHISSEITYESSMELDYATGFSVDYYAGGYALAAVSEWGRFLIVPEGAAVPGDLEGDITVLQQPISNIYLGNAAVMDMFRSMEALDTIRMCGTKAEAWYIEEAKEAMEAGDILYAGKYDAPDYEQILAENCELSIQSAMITYSPEVKEKLESFGIPVLVDLSAYEKHPLGRSEWVKLYGVLVQKEDMAEQAFQQQKEIMEVVTGGEPTGKTVVFCYITSKGTVSVRKSSDYMSKMIELAGGSHMFPGLGEEDSDSSTINMQMEEFYAKAKDADYIIYNSTLDKETDSIARLIEKNSMMKDFKAVQTGNVWSTMPNLYQDTMGLGTMIVDIHTMLTTEGTTDETLSYLQKLE